MSDSLMWTMLQCQVDTCASARHIALPGAAGKLARRRGDSEWVQGRMLAVSQPCRLRLQMLQEMSLKSAGRCCWHGQGRLPSVPGRGTRGPGCTLHFISLCVGIASSVVGLFCMGPQIQALYSPPQIPKECQVSMQSPRCRQYSAPEALDQSSCGRISWREP